MHVASIIVEAVNKYHLFNTLGSLLLRQTTSYFDAGVITM